MKTLIKDGLIYDGSLGEPYLSDILLVEDRIARIAQVIAEPDAMVIDARNLIVTPGFIDSHRHADFAISHDSQFGFSELSQGITTILVGPCGMSAAPYREGKSEEWYSFMQPCLGPAPDNAPKTMQSYLDGIAGQELPLNVGALVGMGSIRSAVKGSDSSPWSERELDEASAMLIEAAASGVFGVSAGIMYTPEYYSTKDDYIRLLASIGNPQLPFVCHMRNEGDGLLEAVEEVIDIARGANVPLNISHFKAFGKENWGKQIMQAIALIERAQSEGQRITVDFYPYTGGATTLMTLVPPACLKKSTYETIQFLNTELGISLLRREIVRKQRGWDSMVEAIGWDRIILSSVVTKKNRQFQGMDLHAIALAVGVDESAVLVRILTEENGNAGIIVMSMDQRDVDTIACLPYASVISDSLYGSPDFPHPRLNGAFVKMLEDYSFNRAVVKPQVAIHKMTQKVAADYQISDRGNIKEGFIADLSIIKPDTLNAEASFVEPLKISKGIERVLLSGQEVYRNGVMTGLYAGSVLRRTTNVEEIR